MVGPSTAIRSFHSAGFQRHNPGGHGILDRGVSSDLILPCVFRRGRSRYLYYYSEYWEGRQEGNGRRKGKVSEEKEEPTQKSVGSSFIISRR